MKKKMFYIFICAFCFHLCTIIVVAQLPANNNNNESINYLPSIPFLPDPLLLNEGIKNIPIVDNNQWQNKRKWIKEQYQYWISGTVPPAPDSINVKLISENKENSVMIRKVELYFGPGNKAKLTVEIMIPPAQKKLPVFMTQWNHRGWAQVAVRRGYIGCVYAGADDKDDTKNYSSLYPGYTFATLMRRAWAAGRAIDYLYMLPEVDTTKIALTGHSRNGKQSLMAAAFDERIKAVVSSSAGTGGENPFRYTDDTFDNESIDDITKNFPDWFHPRLRLFIGKENKLPVDQNSLMALIAPRGLMLSSALTESEGGPWGIEQAFNSAKKVYQFINAEKNLGILFRNGRHGTSARDIENYLDFFDYVFGRTQIKPENRLYYNYSFEKWKQQNKIQIDPLNFTEHTAPLSINKTEKIPAFQKKIREKINWLLGEEPPGISANGKIDTANTNPTDDFLSAVIMKPNLNKEIKEVIVGPYNAAGEYLWANLYLPKQTKQTAEANRHKLPLIIFLHEYSHGTGYRRRSESIIEKFSQSGFAVLAFDMIGYGTRIDEFSNFYQRYPQWSIMGKMVADTRMIINDVINRMDFIDKDNIFLTGYSLGGTVALFTAALDNRIKGTAVVSAFDSWRTNDIETEGIRHFSHLHGLLPRLGFFIGNERRIPVDFDEILAAIAPGYLMVISPSDDRYHPKNDVKQIAVKVSGIYTTLKAPSKFSLDQPETYNHFTESMQNEIAGWFQKIVNHKTGNRTLTNIHRKK